MRILSTAFFCLTLISYPITTYADKVCIRATTKTGSSKVSLRRKVVNSAKKCPSGYLEVSNVSATPATVSVPDGSISTNQLRALGVSADKIGSGSATSGSLLSADGVGGASFTSSANFAQLNANQTFTGHNSFPVVDILTSAGSTASPAGRLNKENVPLAWARVTSNGIFDGGHYNMSLVEKVAVGYYKLTLATPATSGFSLIPVVTPEVDLVGTPGTSGVPPIGAANMRIAAINLSVSGASFEVFIYNGSGALVDNDFGVVVMAY